MELCYDWNQLSEWENPEWWKYSLSEAIRKQKKNTVEKLKDQKLIWHWGLPFQDGINKAN